MTVVEILPFPITTAPTTLLAGHNWRYQILQYILVVLHFINQQSQFFHILQQFNEMGLGLLAHGGETGIGTQVFVMRGQDDT